MSQRPAAAHAERPQQAAEVDRLRLSVIIPTLDEAEHVAQAVDSAVRLDPLEVIVVDGGSRDETVARAERAGARVVRSTRGRGIQLNRGAAAARGDVLLFLHADTWLPPQAARQIAAALRSPSVAGGCFRQRIEAPQRIFRWLEWGNAARARWRGLIYGDQALFLRRDVFDAVGGFPEVPIMEDVILSRQLRRRGTRLVLLEGPLRISPRRWQRYGVVRQTLRNWCLLTAFSLGVSPQRLARFYPPHGRRETENPAAPANAEPAAERAGVATARQPSEPPDGCKTA